MENERQAISDKFKNFSGSYRTAATEKALNIMNDSQKSDEQKKAEVEALAMEVGEIISIVNKLQNQWGLIKNNREKYANYLYVLDEKVRPEDRERLRLYIDETGEFLEQLEVEIDQIREGLDRKRAEAISQKVDRIIKDGKEAEFMVISRNARRIAKREQRLQAEQHKKRYRISPKMAALAATVGVSALTLIGGIVSHTVEGWKYELGRTGDELITDAQNVSISELTEQSSFERLYRDYVIDDWTKDGGVKFGPERTAEYEEFESGFEYIMQSVDIYLKYADRKNLNPEEERAFYRAAQEISEYDGAKEFGFNRTVVKLVKAKYAQALEKTGIKVFDYEDDIHIYRNDRVEDGDDKSVITVTTTSGKNFRITNTSEAFFYIGNYGRMPYEAEEIVHLIERVDGMQELTVEDKALTLQELKAWLDYEIEIDENGKLIKITPSQKTETEQNKTNKNNYTIPASVTMANDIQQVGDDDGR